MTITSPIYKIETDSYLYILDLSSIDLLSVKYLSKDDENQKTDIYAYLRDRKDPILLMGIDYREVMNIFTTLKKFRHESSSVQQIVLG